jgi:tetratricopeptide (TPR) repeat protein
MAEASLLAGDMALAGHYSTRACAWQDHRGPALIQATWSKVPTGGSNSVRVVQLEAAEEDLPDADDQLLSVVERELGNAHARIGNLEDARRHLERSLDLLSGETDLATPTAAQLISLYLEVGDIDSAVKLGRSFAETNDPSLLGVLAAASAAAGDNAAAEEFRQRQQAAAYLPSLDTLADQKPN